MSSVFLLGKVSVLAVGAEVKLDSEKPFTTQLLLRFLCWKRPIVLAQGVLLKA